MFASLFFLAAAGIGQLNPVVIPFGKPRQVERAIAPIQESGPLWAYTCKDSDDWEKPAPPVRIHGNTYYVGTCGIASILITGSAGNILIDGGTEKDADLIAANIRELGFRVSDLRLILTSHEHFDHAGGISKLQRMSGAMLVTSAPAAKVLSSGQPASDDPQFGSVKAFEPAVVGRTVRDGEEVRLGDLMLTAMTTPGHTPGALSWRWVSCDGGVCRTIVYADSLTPISNDTYKYSDHPAYVDAFRASIEKIGDSPFENLMTPHPSASNLKDRIALGRTLLDENGCKAYAAQRTKDLDDRLAKEAKGK